MLHPEQSRRSLHPGPEALWHRGSEEHRRHAGCSPGIGALSEPWWKVALSAIADNEWAERTMAALLRLQTAEV